MLLRGGMIFRSRVPLSGGGAAFQLEGYYLHCFKEEVLFFIWRVPFSFQEEGVHFNWRGVTYTAALRIARCPRVRIANINVRVDIE